MDGGHTIRNVLHSECANLLLSKKNPNRVFVAGQVNGSYLGLHFSKTGGNSWTSVRVSSQYGSYATAVAVDPKNDNIIYVGGCNVSWESILYRSTNGGSAWTDISEEGLQGPINDISIDPDFPNIIYIAHGWGVYRSEDYGSTWTHISSISSSRVEINSLNSTEIFSGGTHGVYSSKDRGNNWQDLNRGFDLYNGVTWLEFDASARILYVATMCGGIYKRTI